MDLEQIEFSGLTSEYPRIFLILQGKHLPGAGDKIFRLFKERLILGCVSSADIRLEGDGIAPIHAVIEVQKKGEKFLAVIYDLASDTGVFVNSIKTVTQGLKSGDLITLGRHTLKISSDISEKQLTQEDISGLILEDKTEVIPIFDYSKSHLQSLEVVMSWCSRILDIAHFVKQKEVRLGQKSLKSDFVIPPLLSQPNFALVTHENSEFSLNIDQKMSGIFSRAGTLKAIEEIQKTERKLILRKDDFAKVVIGEIDFYLSFSPAPPRLKRKRLLDRDPLFFKILLASLVFSFATLLAILNIRLPQVIDAELISERMATVLYQPEKFVARSKTLSDLAKTNEENLKDLKKIPTPMKTTKVEIDPGKIIDKSASEQKEMNMSGKNIGKTKGSRGDRARQSQVEARQGEGAESKGKEGKRGHKKSVNAKEAQEKASRASPQAGKGSGSGNSQVIDEGNVDLLKGASAKLQDLLGNSAIQLGKNGQKVKGFGVFNSQGDGGLALSGKGGGGGGDAASLGGLSDKGRAGGRVGTGMGASGSGRGVIGGKARMVIRTGGDEEAVVMGSIDAGAIEAALLAHKDEFRLCYEKEINAENPNLSGRVGTSFVIGSSGRVTQAGVESTTLKNGNVERCVVNVIRRIQFPMPRGAGVVQVSYPFKYSPTGGGG